MKSLPFVFILRMSDLRKSYTTLEVILIILLVAVWLGVTLPRFGAGDLLNKYRLRTTAYNIGSDIRYTRGLAITNARTYIIDFGFTNREYKIYRDSVLPENQIGETKKIPSEVTGSGTNRYTFYSLGDADWVTGTGAITFSIASGVQWTITVIRATGTALIQKP